MSEAEDLRTGQVTSGYIPGASLPSELRTPISTAIVRVFGSMEWATRATVPSNVTPG